MPTLLPNDAHLMVRLDALAVRYLFRNPDGWPGLIAQLAVTLSI